MKFTLLLTICFLAFTSCSNEELPENVQYTHDEIINKYISPNSSLQNKERETTYDIDGNILFWSGNCIYISYYDPTTDTYGEPQEDFCLED